jgi:hypothetical protein
MFKFLFRLILFAVGAFVAIYLLQEPQGKRQIENFVQHTIMEIDRIFTGNKQPQHSTTCPCRVKRHGKSYTVWKTCPPGMTCSQCCN